VGRKKAEESRMAIGQCLDLSAERGSVTRETILILGFGKRKPLFTVPSTGSGVTAAATRLDSALWLSHSGRAASGRKARPESADCQAAGATISRAKTAKKMRKPVALEAL